MKDKCIICNPFYYLFNEVFTGDHIRFIRYVLPDELLENVFIRVANKEFLDIGCGDGKGTNYLSWFAGKNNEYWGVDSSVDLIEKARKKYGKGHIKFMVDSIDDLLCFHDTVDYVLCSFIFHHLPVEIKESGLKEIYRVLKPDGYLMYIDFGEPTSLWGKIIMSLITMHCEHIWSQMNNEVLDMMEKQGFSIEKKIIKTTFAGDVYCILARKGIKK